MKGTTTMILTDQYSSVSVTVNEDEMNMAQVINELIRPLLLADGYLTETVELFLGSYDEVEDKLLERQKVFFKNTQPTATTVAGEKV